MKWVPWAEFARLTIERGADHRVRRLPTKSQFIALLYGQFSGAASLREIVGGLESHAVRPSAVFSELFSHMVARAHVACAV